MAKRKRTKTPHSKREWIQVLRKGSCSCCTRRVTLVRRTEISCEWAKDQITITTNWTYSWLFVTLTFRYGKPGHGGGRKTFDVMTYN